MFDALDQVALQFSPAQLQLINVAQALLVFGVALHLQPAGLRRVGEHPKAVVVGLGVQWLLLPALAVLLVLSFELPAALACGLLLIACCPGGSAATFLSLLARGNAAVAIATASIAMLASAVLTPLLFALCRRLAGLDGVHGALSLDATLVLRTTLLYLLLPLAAGLALRQWQPRLALRLRGPLKLALGLLLGLFVVVALQRNAAALRGIVLALMPLVAGFHAASLLGAWLLAALLRTAAPERRAITLCAGVSNAGLSMLLVFTFFGGDGAMAALVAWWSVWRLLASGALTLFWSRAPLPAGAA
ncbi:bile acid:sodium symporter family protein [Solimonas soli]|uniref:bile acid:sodium symporter family protein n=1 Tax=Solimonas soli TaxID=413479 RepID=UPI0004AF2A9F|nr:bile acid:sodium symporter [Solimonas soli]